MSIAMWSELQALKARVDELEKRIGVPAPDALALALERLDRLERALKGKR